MDPGTAVRELIRGIASSDARERERAADEVTDVVQSLSTDAAAAVAGALVMARQCETDAVAQQAQLNALVDVCGWHPVPWQVLVGLLRLDRSSLFGSQADHFSVLMEGADKDWDEDSALWEHQGRPLTVLDARRALREAPADVPVAVELYTGSGRETLSPFEMGYSGRGMQPSSVVLTVTRLKS